MDVEEREAKMCRLCGQYERIYIDVFGEEGVRRYLGRKIHRKINILIKENDNMPRQICRKCFEKLKFTCAFYDNCHEIQKKLWSTTINTTKKPNDDNNVEEKENVISPRSNVEYQVKILSENLRKKTHLLKGNSLINDESSKNQNCGNPLSRRNYLLEICPNVQTATSLWTQEQSVGIQENKQDGQTQKKTTSFEKAMKQKIDIQKECSLSENSSSRTSLLLKSTICINSLDWSLRLSHEADKPKNVTNVSQINNSPSPGDEAESNRSSSFESNKLAVPNNIAESPPIVPNAPKKACSLESNITFVQNNSLNKSTVLSGSSIIDRCKVRRSKISELITNEQKQIIETYYLVDVDIMDKYAEEVRNNITIRAKNSIECNLCSAKYSRLDKCEVHIWAHLNIKPYKCKKCSFSTVTLSNVRCHIRKSHLKIKPFACELCPKQYATLALLKEHNNIHIGLRPYKCDTCNFSSTNRQALSNHMEIHASSEDIPCSICAKTFHSRIKMRAHMRIHNNNNVTCDICRVRLSNENALEAHRQKVHVHDHICQICNKAHKSRKALHNHMNVHKEAKYKCTKCPKTYKSKHILNEHLLKHEGIRKYKCSVCEKSFAQQSHLAAHNKVHNPPSYECPGCGRKHNRHDNMKTHMTRCKACQ